MKRFPIGFHLGPGGNPTGIGDWMRNLDAAGIQFYIKSVDTYGVLNEAVELARNSGIRHVINYRMASSPTYNYDVPNYNLSPSEAASIHWRATIDNLPPEYKNDPFHRDLVWLEVVNEVDKERSDWIGWFCLHIATIAGAEGYRVALPAWSTGEPEPEHWLEDGMVAFLTYAAEHTDRVAVAVHEYSLHPELLFEDYPYLIGRIESLFDACDSLGIVHPTTLVTEFGWQATHVPEPAVAIPELERAASYYYDFPNVYGAGIWYLGPGFGGIADKANRLIAPVEEIALDFHYYEIDPPVEPPSGDCDFDDTFTKYHILRPGVMSTSQWNYIRDLMENGIPRSQLGVPGLGNVVVGYEGWSHVDAILAIKRAIEAGFTDSRLIVVDGHLIGTGLNEAWLQENCPLVAAYTVFLRSDGGTPSPFEFTHWPTEYRVVNLENLFGANRENYISFGLEGHEGIDIRAYDGTEIYAVADGFISDIHAIEGSHNYGIFIRVEHQDSYETTYAHLKSVLPTWTVGAPVRGGDLLGYANDTGNSYGSHLHITLKRDGYPYSDDVDDPWPYFIQDPTPFLERLCPECFVEEPEPPAGQPALLGLHATADPALAAGELAMMQTAGIEVVKMLSNIRKEDATAINDAFPDIPVIIRAFLDFGGRDVTPQQFFDWTYPDVVEIVSRVGVARPVKVELHNEPNLFAEGLGSSWENGVAFNEWLISVLRIYRQALGGVEFLYPGLSPGGSVTGVRMDSTLFLEQSLNAVNACDAVGVHNYWSSQWSMALALSQLETYTSRLGSKPMWITEASNNRGDIAPTVKANEYIQYVHEVARWPNFKGVTYFVASASNPAWGWTGGSGEIWLETDIPSIVGSR
jgi:hypothetical protein